MSDAVRFNWRVMRADGRPIRRVEAVAALLYYRDYRQAPSGYVVEVVNWARPRARYAMEAEGTEAQEAAEAFHAILVSDGLSSLRVGAVKL